MTTVARRQAVVPTLPGRYYYEPHVFALEQARIFSQLWICVGLASSVPTIGAYFLANVAGEQVIVLRDPGEVVRAFLNVCRHRGARVCTEPRGQLRSTMQCRYHAWTYALDGRLVGAPNMRGADGFEPAEYGLAPVHVRVWEGLIFVNLSAEPEPLERQIDTGHPRIGRYNLASLVPGGQCAYTVRANWKLLVANYEECAHCSLVHPALSAKVPSFREGLATGGLDDGAPFADGVEVLTFSGKASRPPLPDLLPEEHANYFGVSCLPSLFINFNPDHVGITRMEALGPAMTLVTCEWLFEARETAKPDFDPSDAIEFSDLVKREDWVVCELSQQGCVSRGFEAGGIYGPHERHIRQFDDWVLQRIDPA